MASPDLVPIHLDARCLAGRAEIGEVLGVIEEEGFTMLGISAAHLAMLSRMPIHPDHHDPFDHLLIAQAITEDATFVSEDLNTARYSVRVVTCSDLRAPPSIG